MFNTPGYGNCYTFNTKLNVADSSGGNRMSSMTGPKFGLNLVLNIEQDKYLINGLTKQVQSSVIPCHLKNYTKC
jgi:hypothetical protein